MDNSWLSVLRWTVGLWWQAARRWIAPMALAAVVRGAIVPAGSFLIWLGIDHVAGGWPAQAGWRIVQVAWAAGGLVVVWQFAAGLDRYMHFQAAQAIDAFLVEQRLTKAAMLDLWAIEAAGSENLLYKQGALEYLACGVMGSLFSLIRLAVVVTGLTVLCVRIGWPAFAMAGYLLTLGLASELPRLWRKHTWHEATQKLYQRMNALRMLLTEKWPAKEIRLFDLPEHLLEEHRRIAAQLAARASTREAALELVYSLLEYLGIATFTCWMLARAAGGVGTVGLAAGALAAALLVEGAWTAFVGTLSRWRQSKEPIAAYKQFVAMECRIAPSPSAPAVPADLGDGVVFENVSLSYPGADTPAVCEATLTIRPGERIALVGENGSGKTTFVKLLTRLYDPTGGRILVGGRDLKDYNVATWRSRIGVIFQDFVRYEGTAAQNVGYAQVDRMADTAAIREALAKAGGLDFVDALPHGMDTTVGGWYESGMELSVGQWQKLALARAFFRQADLLVLDEPTSVLDARAEYEIFQRFLELTAGKTTVLISHRFSTVRMADTIYVFRQGRIVERGSHAALMQARGLYAELFNMQADGYRQAEGGVSLQESGADAV
ncbi:MAG: ABC transporter ATP-binding protein [Planctomycetota bacterium]|nr:ABC transporter ATP-binding protein [Planctomycetota bacterium]